MRRLLPICTGALLALLVTTAALACVYSTAQAAFPASYYSGPLGSRNILPASDGGALLGVWSGEAGWTQTQTTARLGALQSAAGRKLDVVGIQYGGGGTFGGQTQCAYLDNDPVITWAISNGSVPYVTWTPNRWTGNTKSVLRQIIDGNRDACINAMAQQLKAKGARIMLRPLHEFDLLRYHRNSSGKLDYTTTQTQGKAVVDAFRRIVSRFQANGATNVGFFWNPTEGGGSREMVGYSYPGNAYVDWIGPDRYNRASSTIYSACQQNGWVEFQRIFNHTASQCGGQLNYHDRFAVPNGKPYFVGETSTRYDAAIPNRKNTWFANIARAKNPADPTYLMENLIGVSVFDQWVSAEGLDWRIDSNATASMTMKGSQSPAYGLNGWAAWATDPRWNVGVLGGPG